MSSNPFFLFWTICLATWCAVLGSCQPSLDAPIASFAPPGAQYSEPLKAELWAAYEEKGAAYVPRTHHKHASGKPKYINRLILESSPYLIQHAHNPVNWRAWSEEAFIEAAAMDKPVLLSVGYSTCHWCHVMERESFEDEEIAAFINAHFVAIKVDREERPDVDEVYMQAVHLMRGRGGWPMTVVMTPDKEPFFGGTYFPARDGDRGARVGFFTLLQRLSAAYEDQRDRVVADALLISRRMRQLNEQVIPGDLPDAQSLYRVVESQRKTFDPVHGGFGSAPKFPRPAMYALLLRIHRRTADAHTLQMVRHSLLQMANGGMYDQIGGGFHRYATDSNWLTPHFEKMLYDNAQLASLYTDMWQTTGEARFREVAEDILAYLVREMRSPEGAFYSATDADSPTPAGHDEEGWFFTWTPAELMAALGNEQEVQLVADWYTIRPGGNFEGRSIAHLTQDWSAFAAAQGEDTKVLKARLNGLRERLYVHRSQRPPPILDDKVLTAWNGLALSAFAKASLAFGDATYGEQAKTIAAFLWDTARDQDGRLYRSVKGDQAKHLGTLADYAFTIQGFLDWFEASGESLWLRRAIELQTAQDRLFWDDKKGGYFSTAKDAEALLVRMKPAYDGAEPAGNSVSLSNLIRFEQLRADAAYRERAEALVRMFSKALSTRGTALPAMLAGVETLLDDPFQVVLIRPDGPSKNPLQEVLSTLYLPNRSLISVEVEAVPSLTEWIPYLEGKEAGVDAATAYVCKRGVCERPTQDPQVLRQQLSEVHPL